MSTHDIPAELESAYDLLECLHKGSGGYLYRVRHRLLGDLRVAKVLEPRLDNPLIRERFIARAQAVSRLSHPNIASVFDFSIDPTGLGHVVLEHVEGVGLDRLVIGGRPPNLDLALAIAEQVLLAVGHLHRHQVAHRHLSAENLMLTRDVEGAMEVKLVELGLVPLLDAEVLTPKSWPVAWLRYAAPELLEGKAASTTSDLYSLGVAFYELFTGWHPIVGGNVE